MYRLFILFGALMLGGAWLAPVGHCLEAAAGRPAAPPGGFISVEDRVPASLAEHLLACGVDIGRLQPVVPGAVYSSGGPDDAVVVILHPEGTGLVVLQGTTASSGTRSALIWFDALTDTYTVQQVPEDCVQQILATFRSMLAVIVDCVIYPDELYCTLNIIDLITNIYLTNIICGAPDEEAVP